LILIIQALTMFSHLLTLIVLTFLLWPSINDIFKFNKDPIIEDENEKIYENDKFIYNDNENL
jgi:hypothetical protein